MEKKEKYLKCFEKKILGKALIILKVFIWFCLSQDYWLPMRKLLLSHKMLKTHFFIHVFLQHDYVQPVLLLPSY